jgi:hypothetical protein
MAISEAIIKPRGEKIHVLRRPCIPEEMARKKVSIVSGPAEMPVHFLFSLRCELAADNARLARTGRA